MQGSQPETKKTFINATQVCQEGVSDMLMYFLCPREIKKKKSSVLKKPEEIEIKCNVKSLFLA